jgi:hypothetical protein
MMCPQCQQEEIDNQFDMVEYDSYFSAQYEHDVDIFQYQCQRGHSMRIVDFINPYISP